MKITTIRILAALLLGTALSGCLSSSGVSTSPPADTGTGGDSGSGSGGDDGGEGTGGDTDGSGGDDDTDDDMDSGGDDDTGDTGDGGDAGSGGLTESDFDAELERIQSMDLSTSMPSDLSASYDGQVKMTAADFEDGFRTLTVMGDLALDLEYSALGTNTAQANTWTGGVTNLHGTSVVADINGEVVEDLDVQGSLTVMPQVTGGDDTPGQGFNNNVSNYGGVPLMDAYMDASGMVLEGKDVSGVVQIDGMFKGDDLDAIDISIIAPLTVDDGTDEQLLSFTGNGYADKQ